MVKNAANNMACPTFDIALVFKLLLILCSVEKIAHMVLN